MVHVQQKHSLNFWSNWSSWSSVEIYLLKLWISFAKNIGHAFFYYYSKTSRQPSRDVQRGRTEEAKDGCHNKSSARFVQMTHAQDGARTELKSTASGEHDLQERDYEDTERRDNISMWTYICFWAAQTVRVCTKAALESSLYAVS